MNKKIFLVAILSVMLLTISVVAVNENAKKEPAQDGTAPAKSSGQELISQPFHETQYTYSTNLITVPASYTSVLTQFVSVPVGGAELTALFSAETNTGATQTLNIRVLDNEVAIPPGTVYFDSSSDEDGWRASSFTFGKTYLTQGTHNITVQAWGGGSLLYKSLTTEIEEYP